MFGDFASDMVTNGAVNRAELAEARLKKSNADSLANSNLALEMMDYAAENLGVRYALAEELAKFESNHPLITDDSLIERLKKAAVAAFHLVGRDFNAAREAGRTFKIPGREVPKLQPPTLLKHDPEQIKQAYAGVIALRNALSEQLKRFDPDNPLLKDLFLQERIRNNAVAAYKTSGDNFDAAREVGRTFKVPGSP